MIRKSILNIGDDNIEVSCVGLGTSSIGGCFGDSKTKDDMNNNETKYQVIYDDIIINALNSGVNWIDTAPWYGDGKADIRVGNALKKFPRASYYISSKVGRYKPEISEMFDFSYDRTLQSIDESIERLGCGHIDLIQVHDPEYAYPSQDIIIKETLPALQKAKELGKIRWIGLTGYPFWVHKLLLEKSTVKIDICLFYCRYGLHDTSLIDSMVPYLKNRGIPFFHASPLGMGLLTRNGPPTWHPATQSTRDLCKQAVEYCEKEEVDISKIALYFVLKEKRIAINIFSTMDVEELKKNLEVASNGFSLSEKEEAVMNYIRSDIFKNNNHSWEGIEPNKYFRKLKRANIKLSDEQ